MWLSFKPKVRNQVRKAEKSNIVCFNGTFDLIDEFYDIYTIRMKQLGTPCYPKLLMHKILEYFPDNSLIFTVKLKNNTIGAGFVLFLNGFVEIPWAATLIEYNSLCPNHKLYWSIIEYFSKKSAHTFDFGRCSQNKGTYHFKKQWGANPVQLYYQYVSSLPKDISLVTPESNKYQKKVELWKKMPLWFTRLFGPYISKQIP
jgi:lipid II:glycine glycyltransferase (peptidoglycan interpeptide bridge formation enzyme)